MEDMVPELEDLEERGYFKKQEIKQIVKKRTHFEYLLKRPAAVKMDFLRLLTYQSLSSHIYVVLGTPTVTLISSCCHTADMLSTKPSLSHLGLIAKRCWVCKARQRLQTTRLSSESTLYMSEQLASFEGTYECGSNGCIFANPAAALAKSPGYIHLLPG